MVPPRETDCGDFGSAEPLTFRRRLCRRCYRETTLSAGATLIGKWSQFDGIPELSQTFNEAVLLLLLGTAIEVVRTKIVKHGSVLEHVIDGREDGSRHRYDRLLDAAARSDAVE